MRRMSDQRFARVLAQVWPHIPKGITQWDQCLNREDIAARAQVDIQTLDALTKEVRLRYPTHPLVAHQRYGLGVSSNPQLVEEYTAWRQGNVITRVTIDLAHLDRYIESRSTWSQQKKQAVRMAFQNAITAAGMIGIS